MARNSSRDHYQPIGEEDSRLSEEESSDDDETHSRRRMDDEEQFQQLHSQSKAGKLLGIQANAKSRKVLGLPPAKQKEMKVGDTSEEGDMRD